MPLRHLSATLAAPLLAAAGSGALAPASATEGFNTCLACHGPGGVSQLPLTPSLAGQPSYYAITRLFLFREGRRNNDAMTAIAKGMIDADLRAFSELIGKQVPRLAGQREDYLLEALTEFCAGTRVGYTAAMSEALAGIKAEELATLAAYLARGPNQTP